VTEDASVAESGLAWDFDTEAVSSEGTTYRFNKNTAVTLTFGNIPTGKKVVIVNGENTDDVVEGGYLLSIGTEAVEITIKLVVDPETCEHTNVSTETVNATCGKDGSETVTCNDCGKTISAVIIPATGEHSYVDGKCSVCEAVDPDYTAPDEPVEPVPETISFTSTAQRVSQDGEAQVWKNGDVTFTNNKAASSNPVANYSNPVRLYAGSEIIVSALGQITKIEFVCGGTSYATALKESIGTVEGATVKVSGSNVIVEFDSPVGSFTVTKLTAQVRIKTLTVTYIPA
ncbi:MAG: hypothetical protein IKA29_02805, partial [Clostridia bacterium]|nr:hypothetical protein [Clostridia bacterium]